MEEVWILGYSNIWKLPEVRIWLVLSSLGLVPFLQHQCSGHCQEMVSIWRKQQSECSQMFPPREADHMRATSKVPDQRHAGPWQLCLRPQAGGREIYWSEKRKQLGNQGLEFGVRCNERQQVRWDFGQQRLKPRAHSWHSWSIAENAGTKIKPWGFFSG